MRVSRYSTKDLGAVVDLFLTAGCLKNAQQCLDEMQRRLTVMNELMQVTVEEKTRALTKANLLLGMSELSARQALEPNELLDELPLVETKEPVLKYEPQVSSPLNEGINDEQAEEDGEQIAAEPGMIRDEAGKVTHVSVKHGEPGYDPEIHENTALKIFCDGKHIETAHTADTVKGVVKYHKKNEQGRIKTLVVHGKVEIKGL